MLSKSVRKLVTGIMILMLVGASVFVAYAKNGSEFAYEIPRMMSMETGNGEDIIQVKSPPTTETKGPFVETHGKAVSMDKDLRDLPQTGPARKRLMREMGQMPSPTGKIFPDPVLQTDKNMSASLALAAPSALASFKGLDLQNWGGGWPPDTHGDVGPTHYIQAVNTSIGIFDKATGNRLAAFTFNNFFVAAGGSGVCATYNQGDPIVLYDQISGRWIITDFAFSSVSKPPYYT
jgi:hypothetical protein